LKTWQVIGEFCSKLTLASMKALFVDEPVNGLSFARKAGMELAYQNHGFSGLEI